MDFLTSDACQPYIVAAVLVCAVGVMAMQKKKEDIALDAEKWQNFTLERIEIVSHDVRRFRFSLQSPTHKLGLPIGQHISFKYVDGEGKDIIRSYTPVTSDMELGYVDFVVKVYFKDTNPNFPAGGKMTQHLNSLKVGDGLLMKGPKGHMDFTGCGQLTIKRPKKVLHEYARVKHIGMIAGGTGITPMLQIIRAVLRNKDDKTVMWLIFANQTEEDILLREELEAFPKDRLKVWYTLDRPPAAPQGKQNPWAYSTGFVNTDMCRAHLPPPVIAGDANAAETLYLVCGPPPMIKFACEPAFKELGVPDHQWFSF